MYPAIDPNLPALSTDDKVVFITGAYGGIGQATASSFAASRPRAHLSSSAAGPMHWLRPQRSSGLPAQQIW